MLREIGITRVLSSNREVFGDQETGEKPQTFVVKQMQLGSFFRTFELD
jgi:hypothetical protein